MEQAKKKFDLLSIFKRFKRKDNNDSQKHHLSKKQQIIVYSAVGVFSLVIVIILGIVLGNIISKNIEIKREYAEIIQIYDELTQEQIKLQDSEYASVYIEEGNRYIPSNNIVTEYTSSND